MHSGFKPLHVRFEEFLLSMAFWMKKDLYLTAQIVDMFWLHVLEIVSFGNFI
jgi:hypothetical protein